MRCALCLQDRPLCDSHIFSEFLYKPLYDDKHKYEVISTASIASEHHQKGIRVPLLCKPCEGKLSRFEDHAARVLFKSGLSEALAVKEDRIEWQVDYTKFKLFEISILWRTWISNRPEFGAIVLGKHESRLRHMLLDGEPGATTCYGCIVTEPVSYGSMTNQLLALTGVGKHKGKNEKVSIVRLLFAGYSWAYFLTQTAERPMPADLFLQASGKLRILKGDFGVDEYIRSFAAERAASARSRPTISRKSEPS